MRISSQQAADFQRELFEHYDRYGRHDLPWRHTQDPYAVLVSELMLQQTQVTRVIPKYQEFIQHFPDSEALAVAELGDVLRLWQGLGYNRRAKYLWQTAQMLATNHTQFPTTLADLVRLPGVGKNTAGAVLAYAYNQPVVFVETNIRTVYFHHFFQDRTDIADKELIALIEATLDRHRPREFYWALMDYGSWLKTQGYGRVAASKHYVRQSKFAGSNRQLRGQVLRRLSLRPHSETELLDLLADDRATAVLNDLAKEGMIVRTAGNLRLA